MGKGVQTELHLFHQESLTASCSKVTVALVEEYIKPLEMVILCVIPAMSDFGNAEALVVMGALKKEWKPII